MNPRLQEQYELSKRPYLEGDTPVDWQKYINMRSWRYVLEINSQCNLHCALCHAGNRQGYEYHPGVMDMAMLEDVLDKIKSENPEATVCAYVNSEPFLNPKLAECVTAIKRRGLKCELATNGHVLRDLDNVIAAHPDLFTVSISGWTQDVYERAHRGGDIEVVKQNIIRMAEANRRAAVPVVFGISYHLYKDNQGEQLEAAKEFAKNLGIILVMSKARAITIENTVSALRELELLPEYNCLPYSKHPVAEGLYLPLPKSSKDFVDSMERLLFHPLDAQTVYAKWPVASVCAIADVFTEIRHDGRVQLCAWTDDMRLTLGDYLKMSQDQIQEARVGHPLCQECLRYRLNLYFHVVNSVIK